jgi:hypothetical protein
MHESGQLAVDSAAAFGVIDLIAVVQKDGRCGPVEIEFNGLYQTGHTALSHAFVKSSYEIGNYFELQRADSESNCC